MIENATYKTVVQTFETSYVIMDFDKGDLKYPVTMATEKEFDSAHHAQDYIKSMGWGKSKMIVPVMREVLYNESETKESKVIGNEKG